MEKINEIDYFKTNKKETDKIFEYIEDKSIKNKVIENGAFCDEDENCKTIVLFLRGSGKIMEIRFQCYDEFIENADHIISEKDKIMNYISQKKMKKYVFLKRKILSKITRDELKIESVEFISKPINKILGSTSLSPVYFSSFSLLVLYLVNLITNPLESNFYLFLLLTSIPINILAQFIINYIGGRKYAYQV
ncbi:MAG: hypothetical protein ACFFEN_10705 [Candidatus Thorarchaeota archaeon]